MSRIGKLSIPVPSGVEVQIKDEEIHVKGPKGALTTPTHQSVKYELEDGVIRVVRTDDSRLARAQHGLRRTLLANAVEGVSKGFEKSLEVVGVGYKVNVKGNTVELAVGYSHPVLMEL
ncbi:50S ribosomal protein L6, partial [Oceanidesulfovibrio indonesiensis]